MTASSLTRPLRSAFKHETDSSGSWRGAWGGISVSQVYLKGAKLGEA